MAANGLETDYIYPQLLGDASSSRTASQPTYPCLLVMLGSGSLVMQVLVYCEIVMAIILLTCDVFVHMLRNTTINV